MVIWKRWSISQNIYMDERTMLAALYRAFIDTFFHSVFGLRFPTNNI